VEWGAGGVESNAEAEAEANRARARAAGDRHVPMPITSGSMKHEESKYCLVLCQLVMPDQMHSA
jgi:hypothetical protein